MPRSVDEAMAAENHAKATIRSLWVEIASEWHSQAVHESAPLYLTLAGSEGREISQLVARGILRLSEVGAVLREDQHRIVAVESSPQAVLALQRRFPGLKILRVPIQNVLRGSSPTRWPDGEDERYCRARVVNLDLNGPLSTELIEEQTTFPVIALISKLAQLHATPPRVEWTLCLTLHGELPWPDAVLDVVAAFLRDNFLRDTVFRGQCAAFLGNQLFSRMEGAARLRVADLSQIEQQKLLMAMVPKRISHVVHTQGWRVDTRRNLHYTGAGGAPMVSWIMDFRWDPRVSSMPSAVYLDSLRTISSGAAHVAQDGSLL